MMIEFIVNPKFGDEVTKSKIDIIKEVFADYDISFYMTKDRKSTISHISSSNSDVVISVGGDGTLNEVVNGIMRMEKRPLLGLIPFGTSNVYAIELGVPIDTREACKRIIENLNHPKPIDIGLVNDEYYFVMWSSVGPDAKISRIVDDHLEDKKSLGRLAFVLYGIPSILMYKPQSLSIRTDSYTGRGHFVIVANGTHYMGKNVIAPDGSITDGLFDVFIFKGKKSTSFLKYFWGILTGAHTRYDDIIHKKAKWVEVSSLRPSWMHVDSEAFKVPKFSAKMLHYAIKFI